MKRVIRRALRGLRACASRFARTTHLVSQDWLELHILKSRADRRLVRNLSVGVTHRAPRPSRIIFVDISVISQNDAGTGIQRVVRSIREHLEAAVGGDATIEFLVVDQRTGRYVTLSGKPFAGAPGHLFFGLDFSTETVFRLREDLRQFKLAGGQLWFLLHDVLPLSHPDWFTPYSRLRYRRWLRVCAALANGFLCVSPVVAAQLQELLVKRYGLASPPPIVTIELGSNITAADRELSESELPSAAGLDASLIKQAALVVGTLEPRKGHADLLDAFDILWGEGRRIPLIFIGRAGWNTDRLQRRINDHQAAGSLLFWLNDVDDQSLHAAYRHCRLAIVPSLAEGFGLPLDEALASGAPVLARDIPVFRRHAAARIAYFRESANAAEIAAAVLEAYGQADRPRQFPPLRRWEETASQVANALLGKPGADAVRGQAANPENC